MRIAEGDTAKAAEVELRNQSGVGVLKLKARDAGVDGNMVRAAVDYNTPSPESRFNLTLFRETVNALGDVRRIDIRSASRAGYSDLGVNRRRIEEIRHRFSGQQKEITE